MMVLIVVAGSLVLVWNIVGVLGLSVMRLLVLVAMVIGVTISVTSLIALVC